MQLKFSHPKGALALFCLTFVLSATAVANSIVVVYPRAEDQSDARAIYPVKVLEMALRHVGKDYVVKPSDVAMLQGRALTQLRVNKNIDVLWTVPSAAREGGLVRIPIPLDKGLIGWRLLLLRRQNLDEFAHLRLPGELQMRMAGQGHDWPDIEILRTNGFKVDGVVGYESLFKTLAQGSIDYFPRSVMEIWAEADTHKAQDIVIEPSIVLHYQNAFYFYVNKSNAVLAADIEAGMEKIIADGTLDKLFHQTFDDSLGKAKLHTRRVVELRNPLFPDDPSAHRAELWFHP
jgi:hypothetical protein